MGIGNAAIYIINCYTIIGRLLLGLQYYTSGGISRTLARLKDRNTSLNVQGVANQVYEAIALNFYSSVLSSVASLIISVVVGGVVGIIVGALGGIGSVVGLGFMLLISSAIIAIGQKNEANWSMIAIKILSVLYLISSALLVLGTLGNIVGLITGFSFKALISVLGNIVTNLISLAGSGCVLNAMTLGVSVSQNNFSQPGFDQQNNSFVQQNSGFSNGFDSQGSQGFGQTSGQGFSQQFNQQSNVDLNKEQTEQMYQCPFCKNPIHYGVNPCPYCGNTLTW